VFSLETDKDDWFFERMFMFKFMDWILTNVVSTDWQTMNTRVGNVEVNLPLSICLTVVLSLASIMVAYLFDWLIIGQFRKSLYDSGFEDGYKWGVHSKLVNLAKIKYNKDVGAFINVYEDEAQKLIEEALEKEKT